ncbi:hypothetical protein HOY80DRAFT_685770 [Tuber brumale]|nr:hypothetical protein HOY80DRAFT_685770 [Tuber brumale]
MGKVEPPAFVLPCFTVLAAVRRAAVGKPTTHHPITRNPCLQPYQSSSHCFGKFQCSGRKSTVPVGYRTLLAQPHSWEANENGQPIHAGKLARRVVRNL